MDFYFTAYRELQADRPVGMAVGEIPWYSIMKWAETHGVEDPDDVDVLLRYIRSMEAAASEIRKKKEGREK